MQATRQIDVLRTWARQRGADPAALTRVVSALEAGSFTLPGLDVRPFYELRQFGWVDAVQARARELIDELGRLRQRAVPHPESDALVTRGYWQAFFLWRGSCERHADAVAATVGSEVTRLAPGGGLAGNSYFSVLGPGTEIRRHVGEFNGRLRCHVGLSVPAESWLDIAGERRRWEVGKCVVFSDALPHHVANDGLDERAVFAFDFWHPDLTAIERDALSLLLTLHTRG